MLKAHELAIPPGGGNLLRILWCHDSREFRVARHQQDGAVDARHQVAPRGVLY